MDPELKTLLEASVAFCLTSWLLLFFASRIIP